MYLHTQELRRLMKAEMSQELACWARGNGWTGEVAAAGSLCHRQPSLIVGAIMLTPQGPEAWQKSDVA